MEVREKILSSVDKDALVRLCQDSVRIPSPTGNEGDFAKFLGETMENMGLSVKFVEGIKGRPNVVGRLKGSVGRPRLLLHAHMDTIGPGDREKWIVDPYGAEIKEGRIYGRGTWDCKGGIAAMVSAVRAVMDAGVKLKGDVLLLGSVGEEDADPHGMPYVVDNYVIPHVRPDMALYCHPRDQLKIVAYFKSLTWWTISTFGKTAHAILPHEGVNAISKMVKIVQTLEKRGLQHVKHPVLGGCTTAFTTITAKPNHYNVIPDMCTVSLNARLVPGQTVKGVKKEIEKLIADLRDEDPDLHAEVQLKLGENPVELSPDEPILKIAEKAIIEVVGSTPEIGGEGGIGDLGPLVRHGIPGTSLGLGGVGNIHKENEFMEISKLEMLAKVYALVILNACEYIA